VLSCVDGFVYARFDWCWSLRRAVMCPACWRGIHYTTGPNEVRVPGP